VYHEIYFDKVGINFDCWKLYGAANWMIFMWARVFLERGSTQRQIIASDLPFQNSPQGCTLYNAHCRQKGLLIAKKLHCRVIYFKKLPLDNSPQRHLALNSPSSHEYVRQIVYQVMESGIWNHFWWVIFYNFECCIWKFWRNTTATEWLMGWLPLGGHLNCFACH
jgi:hypothetical protein